VFYLKVHSITTSVTLCGQSGAATSMHSICMMYTFMLEQFVPVPTALLTRRHTYTLHWGSLFTRRCPLQPLVWPCVVKVERLSACIASLWCTHWCWNSLSRFLLQCWQKIYIHTALCTDIQHKAHSITTSVTLCGQSGAATSMNSICLIHTLMLEQLVPVPTAVLTEDIYTHCTVYRYSAQSALYNH
jgi:hypothetical protein